MNFATEDSVISILKWLLHSFFAHDFFPFNSQSQKQRSNFTVMSTTDGDAFCYLTILWHFFWQYFLKSNFWQISQLSCHAEPFKRSLHADDFNRIRVIFFTKLFYFMNRCFFGSNPAPSIEKQNAYNFCSGKICLQNEERQWTLVITKIILKAERGTVW